MSLTISRISGLPRRRGRNPPEPPLSSDLCHPRHLRLKEPTAEATAPPFGQGGPGPTSARAEGDFLAADRAAGL
jgi:hypothetical protein